MPNFLDKKWTIYFPLGLALWGTLEVIRAFPLRHGGDLLKLLLSLVVFLVAWGALATSVLGISSIRKAGEKAMHSRDALLQNFLNGTKKLPWLLGLFTFLFSCAVAFIIAYETINFLSYGFHGRGVGKLVIAAAIFFLYLIYAAFKSIWKIFRASRALFADYEPMQLMGQIVHEKDAPALWELVSEIAQKTKTKRPDVIITGLDEGFFVTESPVTLISGTPVPPGRLLYVPLPFMAYMSRDEVAAVIGHELGHFLGEDTVYSQRFSPIYASAVRNLRAVHEGMAEGNNSDITAWAGKPALMLGEFFLDSFHGAVQHWSRIRELAADKVGASVTNNAIFAAALMRICVISPVVNATLREFWHKSGKVEGGFLTRLDALMHEHGLPHPEAHLEDQQAHPTDSHPTVSQRFAALGIHADEALLRQSSSLERGTALRELGMESAH